MFHKHYFHKQMYPPAKRETWVPSDPWIEKSPWRRERLPTPVFWPGEFHGLYSPWGCKESDTSERLSLGSHSEETGDVSPSTSETLDFLSKNTAFCNPNI